MRFASTLILFLSILCSKSQGSSVFTVKKDTSATRCEGVHHSYTFPPYKTSGAENIIFLDSLITECDTLKLSIPGAVVVAVGLVTVASAKGEIFKTGEWGGPLNPHIIAMLQNTRKNKQDVAFFDIQSVRKSDGKVVSVNMSYLIKWVD